MAVVKENPKGNYEIPGSQLYVTRLSALWKLFGENKISHGLRGMKWRIYFFSAISTPLQWLQRLVLWFSLRKIDLSRTPPPVFILGHWRSGTTHVHYTLAKDKKFVFLGTFQSFFFNISMLGLGWVDKMLSPLMPKKRPQDNMEISINTPQEEENVLSNITAAAGVHSFYFPKNRSYFYKYNLFKGLSPKEYATWKKYYIYVLKAIYKMGNGRRLLIKNPNNTARAKQLLELFPDAKFIHIHRNPYQVYLSTMHLYRAVLRSQRLQEITEEEEEDMLLENYRLLMQGYLDTRDLIPKQNLIEIAFDDIGTEGELASYENMYKTFELGDWEAIKPTIETYLISTRKYKKNKFVPIKEEIVKRIQEEWAFIFEEYGYNIEYKDLTQVES